MRYSSKTRDLVHQNVIILGGLLQQSAEIFITLCSVLNLLNVFPCLRCRFRPLLTRVFPTCGVWIDLDWLNLHMDGSTPERCKYSWENGSAVWCERS